jgi:hypothetical protein
MVSFLFLKDGSKAMEHLLIISGKETTLSTISRIKNNIINQKISMLNLKGCWKNTQHPIR